MISPKCHLPPNIARMLACHFAAASTKLIFRLTALFILRLAFLGFAVAVVAALFCPAVVSLVPVKSGVSGEFGLPMLSSGLSLVGVAGDGSRVFGVVFSGGGGGCPGNHGP